MDFLNTREWSVVVWLLIVATFVTSKKETRKAAASVVSAMMQPKILQLFIAMFAYTAFCVWLWSLMGLWGWDQLKATLLWCLFSAPPAMYRMATKAPAPSLVKGWVSDTLTVAVLIELIGLTYTFSIWIELVLVPASVILVMMVAIAGTDAKYKPAKMLLESVLMLFGLYLIGRGGWLIATNWSSFATVATLRDTYVSPLLSFTVIPFFYAIYLYARYDEAFVQPRLYIKDKKLKDYACTLAMIAFHIRIPLLKRWSREVAEVRPGTRDQIKDTIKTVLRGAAREKNPPKVPDGEGWCPFAAGRFLAEDGFAAGDYHESYGDWFSSAPLTPVTAGPLSHNMAYYIDGDEAGARKLKLKLYINGTEDRDAALARFWTVARKFLAKALPSEHAQAALEHIAAREPFHAQLGPTAVGLRREDFPNTRLAGYELTLELSRDRRAAESKISGAYVPT